MRLRRLAGVATAALLAIAMTSPSTSSAAPDQGEGRTATGALVRLTGTLVTVPAERGGTAFAALRVGTRHVPLDASTVAGVPSGRRVTLDVRVPADVRSAAARNATVRRDGVDGREHTVALAAEQLADAGDGSPASASSAVGRATVLTAQAPGGAELAVADVVSDEAPPSVAAVPVTDRALTAVRVRPAGVTTARPQATTTQLTEQIAGASDYWADNTRGNLTLSLADVGATFRSTYGCDEPWGMWDQAAQREDFAFAPDTSLYVSLPPGIWQDYPECNYGFGSLGVDLHEAGTFLTSAAEWPVLAHEVGHNISLFHANYLHCPTADARMTSMGGWPSSCDGEEEYGDSMDVMSVSAPDSAPLLSSPQARRLGILGTADVVTVPDGTRRDVTLRPLTATSGTRVAIVRNASTGITYYVEYRRQTGRDSSNPMGHRYGVRILRNSPLSGGSIVLDASPTGSTWGDPTLRTGATFHDYDGDVTIQTLSTSSTGAVVAIANDVAPLTTLTVTAKPVITGTPRRWATLQVTPPTFSPSASAVMYQWRVNGVAIPGATGTRYKVVTADEGKDITVRATATRSGYRTTTTTSAAKRIERRFTVVAVPKVIGYRTVGSSLRATTGSFSPTPTSYTYRWKRDGVAISGAYYSTYRLDSADRGRLVSVTVTAKRTGYTSRAATSTSSLIR
ncbi:hypothetical protein [Janibacter sp. G56]|uniref:hypothetical protein n=1 Tax=Janibacter sp. G56 TaxID=3418717 RepID=UPI003D045311